ncbi:hypothetical protein D5S17_32855 [Pseudonocardiaceae bacterium YIM PH 21723]|nr:hypothetical protein D5S17_32855 [Pseudonocardiaceae bacterium YIM PH 21723]
MTWDGNQSGNGSGLPVTHPPTPQQIRRAQLTVARAVSSPAELEQLLDMLGLLPGTEDGAA